MDLRQLDTLVAIADHRTFSAAAKALFTVQSNVSAHVAKLERELGVTLVDRQRGALTSEGRVVVARARRIQAELDAMHADLASQGTEISGDARMGMIPTTARWLLPPVLQALQERHPRVRLVVTSATSASLGALLQAGTLDAAVLALPVDDPDMVVTPLFREDLVLVTPPDHDLAGRTSVTMADLAEVPLLLQAPGTSLRDELEVAANRAGVRLRAVAEIDGVRLLASLALDGHGPAIVPVTTLPTAVGGIAVVRITDLAPREVGLVRQRRCMLSLPAHAVFDLLQQVLVQHRPSHGIALVGANEPDDN